MKLTILLLTVSMFSFASVSGQLVSLSGKEVTLQQVFQAIQKQTGYAVLANKSVAPGSRKVSINVTNATLTQVLDMLVKDHALEYSIQGSTVFINIRQPIPTSAAMSSKQVTYAQLNGQVMDSTGKPLSGASISVKGRRSTTMTNEKGEFVIDVAAGEILVISYIGFESTEVTVTADHISGAAKMVIGLRLSLNELKEIAIVNTGYQRINRGNLTGSVVTVGSEELEKRNATNIMQNLEGVVPGLVQYRGSTTIRGVSTLQANANILVVVDGLPIEGTIANVNPYDVESVSVLKDAAAAAIYGARASNGVIVITTKRARGRNKTTLDFSSNITVSNKPDYSYMNYMTPTQQVNWESNYYNWWFTGGGGSVANPISDFENTISLGNPVNPVQYAYYQRTKGTITQAQMDQQLADLKQGDFASDFKEHALKNQVVQQYNLALRTNSGQAQNSLVVNYTGDNVGIIHAFNRQVNLFYKGSYGLGKWLDIDYGVNSVIGRARSHNSDFATSPFNVPSYYRLFNEDGSRAYYNTSQFNQYNTVTETGRNLYSSKFNHLAELERDFINTRTMNTRYYVNLNFRVIRGLTINPMVQYEDIRRSVSAYSEPESYTMRWLQNVYTTRAGTSGNYTYTNLLPKGGKLATAETKSPNYTARLQGNFERELGRHGFIAIAGGEVRQTRIYGQNGVLLGYDDQLQTQATNSVNFGQLYAINSGTFWNANYPTRQYHFNEISDIGLTRDEIHRFASGYANLTYTYDRKYNLFGSIRKDYADLFGGDEKYRGKPLWSVGASWVASGEDFLKSATYMDYLKLRGSYGLTGNIRNVTAVLAATTGTNPITQLPNATVSNPPNPQLRWEKTATTNVGIDFAFFGSRLRGALDWYRRKGTDLFAQKRLDPSEGFTSMVINNASMINTGFEANVSYDWIKSGGTNAFRWSSALTGAFNKNKITSVDELTRNPITLAGGGSYKVGYPVRSVFSFRFAGLNANGIPQWYDAKGTATTATLGPNDAESLDFTGNADPRVNMSFNNDFSFKGFTLSVFAVYYGGHYFRARAVPIPYPYSNYGSLPSYLLDAWTPSNTDTDVPGSGQYYQVPLNNQYYYSDNLVRAADFIKIRNVVLAYSIPKAIASKIRSSSLNLRFQVNNPKSIWTKQTDVHIDPETGGAPIPTSFVFGLNANF